MELRFYKKKTLCQIMRGKKSDFKGREKYVRKKNRNFMRKKSFKL